MNKALVPYKHKPDLVLPAEVRMPESYELLPPDPLDPFRCPLSVMTNLDHSVNWDVAERLKEGPYAARYFAANFCGDVWFDKELGVFACEVWRFHVYQETIVSEDLEDIMAEASDKYGWE